MTEENTYTITETQLKAILFYYSTELLLKIALISEDELDLNENFLENFVTQFVENNYLFEDELHATN